MYYSFVVITVIKYPGEEMQLRRELGLVVLQLQVTAHFGDIKAETLGSCSYRIQAQRE